MSKGNLMRASIASVLFAAFESLAGNREGAIPHVIHSRRLIEQLKESHSDLDSTPDFSVDLDAIEPLVAHYERQVGSFVYEDDPSGLLNIFDINTSLNSDRLTDARVALEQAIANFGRVTYKLHNSPDTEETSTVAQEKTKCSSWLQRWDAACTVFLAQNCALFSRETLDRCRLLKAHHMAMSTLVDIDYDQGETGAAAFTPRYRIIIALTSAIVETLPKRGPTAQVSHAAYFSSAMGMTEPLYCTATRCTDRAIAEEAKSLMKRLPLSEGVHSPWKVAFIEKTLCAATNKPYSYSAEDKGLDETNANPRP